MKKKVLFSQTAQKILLLFLMFISTNIAFPQGYQSFFGTNETTYHIFINAVGKNQNQLGTGWTSQFVVDTRKTAIINDTAYLYCDDYLDLYIREDTNTGRIFRRIDNKEYVICDMTLNEGDTFTLPVFENLYYAEEGYSVIVDSVREEDGRKVIYFAPIDDNLVYHTYFGDLRYGMNALLPKFVEGIGPSYGPFGFLLAGFYNMLSVLLCVDKENSSGEEIPTHALFPHLGCYQFGAGIEENEENILKVYPNPATTCCYVDLQSGSDICRSYKLYDLLGREVKSNIFSDNQNMIDLNELPKGIYILEIFTNNNITYSSKIIKS